MKATGKFIKAFFEKYPKSAGLILSPPNRFYLTGFSSSAGAVLVTKSEIYLIVDFRYYEMAKNKNTGFNVVLANGSLLSVVKEICDREEVNALVVEDDYLTVLQNKKISSVFEGYEIEYFGDFISRLRSVKESDEIARMKNAQELTDSAFLHILNTVNGNMTENEVAAEIEYYFKKNGASCAFDTVCVSGAKSSLPHGEPSDIKITNDSFLTIDFGARLDGYCADMTRTIVVGKATDEMKRVYGIVLDAQNAAFKKIHADVIGRDVDKAARDVITENGYGDCFGHATGHGLGIEVHEYPSFSPSFDLPVEKGSVMSVEPGIYIEGKFGVRIEDVVIIGENSYENITKSDKNLIEIY